MGKRTLLKVLSISMVLLLLLSASSVAYAAYRVGVVRTPTRDGSAHVRSGPGTGYSIRGYVRYGDKLTVYSTSRYWYRVKVLRTGIVGYVSAQYVVLLDTPTEAWGDVGRIVTKYSGSTVNLRYGPGTSYGVKRTLSSGQKLSLIGKIGAWREVQLIPSGTYGYVSNSYVRAGLPAVTLANVHLRKRPSNSGAIIRTVPINTGISVYNIDSYWSKVKVNGKTGYMYNQYFSLN